MSRLTAAFKRAFAIENDKDFQPTPEQQEVVDKICTEVVRRKLVTPALMCLELSRPLNFVSAHAMHFFQPLVSVLLNTEGYNQFASFLEHRGSIEHLCRRIEHFESLRMQKSSSADANSNHTQQPGKDAL